ncbi:MAG: hypothetical protein IPN18_12600 [Ignavibacteriales bacterium]|nr:hypothetical protein [Ignavibacteriales bacterium]
MTWIGFLFHVLPLSDEIFMVLLLVPTTAKPDSENAAHRTEGKTHAT